MKFINACLCLCLTAPAFAVAPSTAKKYADFYATDLLAQFDKEIDIALLMGTNPLESLTYAKLQGAKAYLDELDKVETSKTLFYPEINAEDFKQVKAEIDNQAEVVLDLYKNLKSNPYYYPSIERRGNINGNDFPKNVWALTFDDGPRPGKTAKIIDNLLSRNMRATFFMPTAEAKRYLTAARDVRDRGMDIALHSYTHANLPKVTDATLKYEITQAKIDLEKALDIDLKLFRLPYGAGVNTTKIRKLIADNNLIHVFWNIDTLDWKDKNPKSVLERAIKLMKATPNHSGVILFHDIHETTYEASRLVVDYLERLGNKVCSVQEVVDGMNGSSQQCY